MNLTLGLDWRRGYAPMAGLVTSFTSLSLQPTSGDIHDSLLFVGQPTMGLPGPSPQFNAVEFNAGTTIQRAVSRTSLNYIFNPPAFHTRCLFYISQREDSVIWSLGPGAHSPGSATWQVKLHLTQVGGKWVFYLEFWGGDPASPTLLAGFSSYIYSEITAGAWYDVVTSIPYTINLDYAHLCVNGSYVNSQNGYLISNDAAITMGSSFFSLADDDQYDGILGQTEGAFRFKGKIAHFAYSTSSLSSSDYDPSYPGEFSSSMLARLYGTAMTWASPFERPFRHRGDSGLKMRSSLKPKLGFTGASFR